MEPIRPDDDELRAGDRPAGTERKKKQQAVKPDPSGGKGGSSKRPKEGGGSGRSGGNGLLWVLLVIVAGAAGAGWYLQNERLAALEAQLDDAESWSRQSKLALARFEGELSETGESLQERGETLDERITANDERLETADSEIRKLWAVANERNKGRLDDHQQQLGELDETLATVSKSVRDLETTVEQTRSSLSGDISQLGQRLEDSVVALEKADQEMASQVAGLDQQMSEVDQRVDSRLDRFEREQKLTLDGLDSRIGALEKEVDAMAGNDAVRELRGDMEDLRKTVDAIDASRSQLTSRLIRLSEEVNNLRSQ